MVGDRVPRTGAAVLPFVAGWSLLVLHNGESGHVGFLVGGIVSLVLGVVALLWGIRRTNG